MPASLTAKFPMLAKVMGGERPSAPPWYHITSITSQGGKTFTSFAKYKKYGQGTVKIIIKKKNYMAIINNVMELI